MPQPFQVLLKIQQTFLSLCSKCIWGILLQLMEGREKLHEDKRKEIMNDQNYMSAVHLYHFQFQA